MSEFYHILNAHLDLLRKKGYHEKDLGSPNLEGRLFKDFHFKLSDAINEALQFGYSTDSTLEAIGYFENQVTDPVNINISYRFNPEHGDLSIDRLMLELDGKVITTTIKSNEQLPHSREIPAIVNRETLKKNRILLSTTKVNSIKRKQ